MHFVSVPPVRPICFLGTVINVRASKRLKAFLSNPREFLKFADESFRQLLFWEFMFKQQPRQPWLAEKDVWDVCINQNMLRSRSEPDYTADFYKEAAFVHQQSPEELSQTLVAFPVICATLQLMFDGRRRIYTLLMQECHQGARLAHPRARLNNRSPSFYDSILISTHSFSLNSWVSALVHEESATFPPLTHLLAGHFSLSWAKHVGNVSVWGVSTLRGMHTAWNVISDLSLCSPEIRRIRTTCGNSG